MKENAESRTRWIALAAIVVVAIGLTTVIGPVPQPAAYHHFADARTMLGIPRALDVLSNIPFVVVGLIGLVMSFRLPDRSLGDRWGWITLFAGLLLTGFGSAYYHLAPANRRLVWDRLPMTLVMSGFLSLLLMNRVRAGISWVLPALLAIGFFTVLHWSWSEESGQGDLRWYLLFQGLVIVTGVLLLTMFPAIRIERTRALVIAIAANVAAKIFEFSDRGIFSLGGIVSGHTLKHLSAGLGFVPVLVWLATSISRPTSTKAAASSN